MTADQTPEITWNVLYADGTYGEAREQDDDAAAIFVEDMLCRGDVEMARGAVRGAATGAVSLSTFGSERAQREDRAMTTDQTHEGWTNYATWGVALVLDNEQSTQEECREQAAAYVSGAPQHENVIAGIWSATDAARFGLEDWLKDYTECLSGLEDDPGPSLMARQVIQSGLAEVNWGEIAASILDGLED